MRGVTTGVMVVAALMVLAGGAAGSVIFHLAGDTNASLRGMAYFQGPDDPKLSADVEYAVYAPGTFDDTFGSYGFTYPVGTESSWFYAYEVFNDLANHPWPVPTERDYVKLLTVGTDPDSQAANAGFVVLDGHQAPNVSIASNVTHSAKWIFSNPTLNYGGESDVLYFTSPYGPGQATATLSGGYADMQILPSPLPEPATLFLLAAGGGWWLRRRTGNQR